MSCRGYYVPLCTRSLKLTAIHFIILSLNRNLSKDNSDEVRWHHSVLRQCHFPKSQTTLHWGPDYTMIIVNANAGFQRMSREHLGIWSWAALWMLLIWRLLLKVLNAAVFNWSWVGVRACLSRIWGIALALRIPFFIVVTKIDIAPQWLGNWHRILTGCAPSKSSNRLKLCEFRASQRNQRNVFEENLLQLHKIVKHGSLQSQCWLPGACTNCITLCNLLHRTIWIYLILFDYSYILEHILLRQFFSFAICAEVKCSEAAASCGEGNGSAGSCSIWYLQQRGPPMSTAARFVTQISSKSREIRIPWRKQHKLCVFEKLKPWVSLLSVEPLWIVMKKVRPVAVLNVASCC